MRELASKDMNHETRQRKAIRLKGFDYSKPGAYFVTICSSEKKVEFGQTVEGKMRLNEIGEIVQECWRNIPKHFPSVLVDEFVVMPNHLHGVLFIEDDSGTACRAPTAESFACPTHLSLPTIIRSFKSAVTRAINLRRKTRGRKMWQRGYYERVVRDEKELSKAREYIVNNPLKWELDKENPDRSQPND